MLQELFSKLIVVGICFLLLLLNSCRVYHVSDFCTPCVEVPTEFQNQRLGIANIEKWWKAFKQPELDELMEVALVANLDIQQAWSRLAQARASVCIAKSEKWPEIDLTTDLGWTSTTDRIPNSYEDISGMSYLINPSISYEVDLWRRIDSQVKSTTLDYCATREDLEATALTLTGEVASVWLNIQQQQSLIDVIHYQIEVSETLLDLVELRFAVGEASALDVYQQRLQLENVRSTLIPVEVELKSASYQLNILLGRPPVEFAHVKPGITSIKLPEFPDIGSPAELLSRRPDLRSVHYNLRSADYQVAAAIANIFPRLTLPTFFELSSIDWANMFQQEFFSITADLVTPIFDACRRRCEVSLQKAVVRQQLELFGQLFLNALGEVETAIVNEDGSLRLLAQYELEIDLAEKYLQEARVRNAMGLNDYLTVISAIQTLQSLQRALVNEHSSLLQNRTVLYRALGAPCIVTCPTCGNCNGSNTL